MKIVNEDPGIAPEANALVAVPVPGAGGELMPTLTGVTAR